MDYSGIINIWLDNNKDFITRKLKKYNNKLLKVQKRTTQIKKIFSDLRTIDPVLYKKIQSGGQYFNAVYKKLELMDEEIKKRDINVGDLTSKVLALITKINKPININTYSDNLVATANIVSHNPGTQQYNIHRQLHKVQQEQPPENIKKENIKKYEIIINDLYEHYKQIKIPNKDYDIKQFTHAVTELITNYSGHTNALNADLIKLRDINTNLLSITIPDIKPANLKTITEDDLKRRMSKILLVSTEDNFLYSQSETQKLSTLRHNIFEQVMDNNKRLQLQNLETEYNKAKASLSGGINYSELFNTFLLLHTAKNKLQTTFGEYKQECDKYIDNYNSIYAFVTFLITNIINNMLKDKISKYKYLNRNIIVLYKKRLEKLKNTIENANTSELLTVKHQYSFVINFTFEVFNWLLSNDQNKITDTNFVDVEKCEGDLRRGLWYFEFFRPTLDYLYSKYQQKVNLYARINNILKPGEQIRTHHFTKQDDDILKYSGQEMKFSMVFDQPSLLSLSDSMSLPSDLALKKSVMLLTSGYSGTGKTYTLFGKDKTAGILHETLKNISGLKQLYFRVFEIYGLAVPYSFYFDKGIENISNNIFWHSIDNDNHSKIDEVVIEAKDITDFLKKKISDTYSVKNPHSPVVSAAAIDDTTNHKCFTQIFDIDKFFDNFKDIITTKIDNKRKYNSYDGSLQKEDESFDPRICATPNNSESSRSILVYDFRLMISNDDEKEKTDEVKLLVVDMPGRENIYKTYVESYVDNPYLKKVAFNDLKQQKKIKMILSFISLHPLFMGFFNGIEVLNCYNKLSEEERASIFNHYQRDPTQRPNDKKNILSYTINNKETENTLSAWFSNNDNYEINLLNTKKGFNYLLEEQYQSLIALFIMYNLIMLNKFDIIKKIIKIIVDKEINELINGIQKPPTVKELETLKQNNLITRDFALPLIQQKSTQDLTELKKQLRCNIALKAQQACSINENVMATYLTALKNMTSSKKTIYEEQPKIDIDKERNVYRIQSQCTSNIDSYPNDERNKTSQFDWIQKIREIYKDIKFNDYLFDQQSVVKQFANKEPNSINEMRVSDFKNTFRIYPLRQCERSTYWYDLFDTHIKFLSEKYYSPNKIFNITTPVMKTIIESIFMPNTSEIVQASALAQAPAQAQEQIPTETPWECKIVHILANFHESVNYDYTGQEDLLTQIRELANIIG